MKISYKNEKLEKLLIGVNVVTAAIVTASFVALFGFYEPLFPKQYLYSVQFLLLFVFIAEKIFRAVNSVSFKEYLRNFWFEILLFAVLIISLIGAGKWFAYAEPAGIRHITVGVYLILQVVIKVCRTVVNMAASGRNPTQTLILSFLILIIAGSGLLMLPRSSSGGNVSFIDSLFTATSATCVTGLIVKDTGRDFSIVGQIVILTLIQLGGLGIVVFGAVFALLLRQALSVKESVAMQDLLSAKTLSRIGNMIVFIFIGTVLIEGVGAVSMFEMWNSEPNWVGNVDQQWFCSIFHSISSFCNAGFSLFGNSFVGYSKCWQVYAVVCPLIILGGLGFSVLYDLTNIAIDRTKLFLRRLLIREKSFMKQAPKKMTLQSKIVLSASAILIVLGMLAILTFEHYAGRGSANDNGIASALFQSVTARTAGFNTVKISELSDVSRFVLILLMFVGGSPGSTAGGIKTVTFVVIIMTVVATLRKRREVEMYKRSIRLAIVARAITVTLLFVMVLFTAALALSITESSKQFSMSDVFFETASALGTVGLSTGITASLTTAGKLIIIFVMLIGRLGPLTLLALLTFDIKPIRYDYPEEAIIVG